MVHYDIGLGHSSLWLKEMNDCSYPRCCQLLFYLNGKAILARFALKLVDTNWIKSHDLAKIESYWRKSGIISEICKWNSLKPVEFN